MGVSGQVIVNGENRSKILENFRNNTAYILQEDCLRPHLTVYETIIVAAHLKLGFKISTKCKKQMVCMVICYGHWVITLIKSNQIFKWQIFSTLQMLGLEHRYDTKCGLLSGGERKRMSIALELISNPTVLFLDEPTT